MSLFLLGKAEGIKRKSWSKGGGKKVGCGKHGTSPSKTHLANFTEGINSWPISEEKGQGKKYIARFLFFPSFFFFSFHKSTLCIIKTKYIGICKKNQKKKSYKARW